MLASKRRCGMTDSNTTTIDPKQLVEGVAKLASLPEVCVRVNEMVDDPRCSAADIGKVISRDTALTAQLLRIANSAFFNFPSKVDTIARAITVIGERELRYLVLAMSAVRGFAKIPVELTNMASFWRHSVYCGSVARVLARKCHVLHSERLFVAGLLHDVGLLVLMNRLPEQERKALALADASVMNLAEAEAALYGGVTHADVGAALLSMWGLPDILCETVACHHRVADAEEARLDAAIIHLANVVANRAEAADDSTFCAEDFDPLALTVAGLTPADLDGLAEEVAPMFVESWALIQPMVRHAQ